MGRAVLDRVAEVVRYVVVRRLAGREEVLSALEMYFLRGLAPSEIARALGVPKPSVQRWVYGVYRAWLGPPGRGLREAVRLALAAARQLEPLARPTPHGLLCRLCGLVRGAEPRRWAATHVLHAHGDLVRRVVAEVVKELEELLEAAERRRAQHAHQR